MQFTIFFTPKTFKDVIAIASLVYQQPESEAFELRSSIIRVAVERYQGKADSDILMEALEAQNHLSEFCVDMMAALVDCMANVERTASERVSAVEQELKDAKQKHMEIQGELSTRAWF